MRSWWQKRYTVPSGPTLCVLCVDVEHCLRLRVQHPAEMAVALETFQRLVRTLIRKHTLYEATSSGDSFLCVSQRARNAVAFALELHCQLQTVGWRENRLRARVGVHYGDASATHNPETKRFEFRGPAPDVAVRLRNQSGGGQVLVTGAVLDEVATQPGCGGIMGVVSNHGLMRIDDTGTPMRLYQRTRVSPIGGHACGPDAACAGTPAQSNIRPR